MNTQSGQGKQELADRYAGCLLGLAVGDVLGAPLEGMAPETIRRTFGRVENLVCPPMDGEANWYYWRLPGLHTDDTQQAITLADVLADTGALDGAEVMRRWREMFNAHVEYTPAAKGAKKAASAGCHRGTGGGFRKRIKHPEAPIGNSWGDGAAMRVAPIGLFFRHDRCARVRAAIQSAVLTHGHPHASASAVAVAACVAAACSATTCSPDGLLDAAISEIDEADTLLRADFKKGVHPDSLGAIGEFAETLRKMRDWLPLPLIEALEQIRANGDRILKPPSGVSLFATQSASLLAVPTALLVALRNLNSFDGAVTEAINLGGDTDTIGAMAGAVVGSALGESAIPENWIRSVTASTQIRLRAIRLLSPDIPPGFVEQLQLEIQLSRLEMEERERARAQSGKTG